MWIHTSNNPCSPISILTNMKKLFFLIFPIFFLFSCDNSESISQNESVTLYPDSAGSSVGLMERRTTNPPFVHYELMSENAERRIGGKPYIFILPLTYKTDNSAKVCIDNIKHAAEVANGSPDTNYHDFPYAYYAYLINRFNTWLYVSPRLHPPSEIPNIKKWMIDNSRLYHSAGIKIDSSKNPACILKIAWQAPELKP